nr:hypothetical protein [Brevundimonas naejangsanensis]
MIAALIVAGAFLAGFWLGGAFLTLAIVKTMPDDETGNTGRLMFSLLWPITLLMSDEL